MAHLAVSAQKRKAAVKAKAAAALKAKQLQALKAQREQQLHEKLGANKMKEFKDATEESKREEKQKLANRLDESALFKMRDDRLENWRKERHKLAAAAAKEFADAKQAERIESGEPPLSAGALAQIEYKERFRLFADVKKDQLNADEQDQFTQLLRARIVKGRWNKTNGEIVKGKYITGSSGFKKDKYSSVFKASSYEFGDGDLAVGEVHGEEGERGDETPEGKEEEDEEDDDDDDESLPGSTDFDAEGALVNMDPAGLELPTVSVTGDPTPPWIIHPQHPYKTTWDSVVAVVIIYSVLAVPFQISFFRHGEGDGVALVIVDAIVDSLFGIDIVVTFRTAFFDEELLGWETTPANIASRYSTRLYQCISHTPSFLA